MLKQLVNYISFKIKIGIHKHERQENFFSQYQTGFILMIHLFPKKKEQ